MVDFPDAERPVNQMVKPGCLRNVLRSAREREGCQVMLLWMFSTLLIRIRGLEMVGWWVGGVWRGTHVAIVNFEAI